jgi:hypothetical protein
MRASTTSARVLVESFLVAVADGGGFSSRSSTKVGRHFWSVNALWMM